MQASTPVASSRQEVDDIGFLMVILICVVSNDAKSKRALVQHDGERDIQDDRVVDGEALLQRQLLVRISPSPCITVDGTALQDKMQACRTPQHPSLTIRLPTNLNSSKRSSCCDALLRGTIKAVTICTGCSITC